MQITKSSWEETFPGLTVNIVTCELARQSSNCSHFIVYTVLYFVQVLIFPKMSIPKNVLISTQRILFFSYTDVISLALLAKQYPKSDRSHGPWSNTTPTCLLLPASGGIFVSAWMCVSDLLSWSCEWKKLECLVVKERHTVRGMERMKTELRREKGRNYIDLTWEVFYKWSMVNP